DGQRVSIETQDTLDAKNWLSNATSFDATGAISERVTIFDDGVMRTESFTGNGVRTAISSADLSDAFAWDTRTTAYNADSTLSIRETVMDSGAQIVFAYQADNSQRDWRLEIDGDGSSDWLYRVTEYDADGANPVVTTYDTDAALPALYSDYAAVEMM
ncbi:MAG: hypothetical protein KC448_14120, partial [Yoonia sp.]|nr:hypothetical protein [Yoonia sp.]